MRNIFVLVVAMLGMLVSAPAQAQTSYTLWCRGGGGMQMVVGTNAAADGRVFTWLQYHFTPMATPATVATPPDPGECSWLDRPVHDVEPQLVQLYVQDVYAVSTIDGGSLTVIDFNGAGGPAADARALWNAYQTGQEFRVEIYNTGEGYMRVTRVQR